MAAIIRCCSSFSHTSGDRPQPREKSRGQETGKLITTVGCSLVRKPRVHHPISKIKHFSTQPKERESKGILQSPFGSVETFDKLSAFEVTEKAMNKKETVEAEEA